MSSITICSQKTISYQCWPENMHCGYAVLIFYVPLVEKVRLSGSPSIIFNQSSVDEVKYLRKD